MVQYTARCLGICTGSVDFLFSLAKLRLIMASASEEPRLTAGLRFLYYLNNALLDSDKVVFF